MADQQLKIYFMNLKPHQTRPGAHGDCSLILFPTGETLLLDSSLPEYAGPIIDWLRSLGVRQIDWFWASHYHIDHVGAISRIAKEIPVLRYLGPQFDRTFDEGYQQHIRAVGCTEQRMRAGDTLDVGDVHIRVLFPFPEMQDECNDALIRSMYEKPLTAWPDMTPEALSFQKENFCTLRGEMGNIFSNVFRLTYGSFSMLFTGDMHMETEQFLLDHYSPEKLHATVTKIPHHYVQTSGMPAYIRTVRPRMSVALGDGRWAPWEKKALEEVGALDLVTGVDGEITLATDGHTLTAAWGKEKSVSRRFDL